ncbi:MAG: calcium-binding protein [Xenococcaceae cyanobacterium MO_188.B19]|nr:calcium-binding protein [Xenococcaceae cyanobacterium MO_188.B19]
MLNNNSYIGVLGDVLLSNYSHNPSGVAVDSKANTIVASGEAIAEAEAEAEAFFDNLKLSRVFIENSGFGIDGVFEGSTESESQIIANFEVKKGETFSLDFVIDSLIEANEIDNIDLEYNQAELNIGFLVIDSSGNIIDHAYLEASLISSEQIGDVKINFSNNFKLNEHQESYDLGGNNEIDFVASLIKGTYVRSFNSDTNLTLLKINSSSAYWFGDFLINNLGSDFIYGTIHDDLLFGTQKDDNFYTSFGNDILFGWDGNDQFIAGSGNDWLYGGSDDDSLYGQNGDDSLYGETGDDLLRGDIGNDSLYGGSHKDELFGGSGDDWLYGENGDDLLDGGEGKDWLYGGNGDDIIKGGEADDIIKGGGADDIIEGGNGNDTLTGNKGVDQFVYRTVDSFSSATIGTDIITDLEVNTDKIILSQKTFTVLTSTTDGVLNPNEFEVVANDELAAFSSAFIIYSSDTGNLFYNQNGSDEGLGQGGQFATLRNIPLLQPTEFLLSQ